MTLQSLLDQIEKTAQAATPGPWDNRCREFSNTERARHIWSEYGWLAKLGSPLNSAEADAAHIALLNPTTALKLVRVVRFADEFMKRNSGNGIEYWMKVEDEQIAADARIDAELDTIVSENK